MSASAAARAGEGGQCKIGRLTGNPVGYRGTLADRFNAKWIGEPNSGCWLWLGSIDRKGYGQIREPGGARVRVATHVALEVYRGEKVPDGRYAMHRCDTPSCVNPDHLFVGTPLENQRDSIAKGRKAKPPPSTIGRGLRNVCVRGHSLSGENIYFWKSGKGRSCKECQRIRKASYKARSLGRVAE